MSEIQFPKEEYDGAVANIKSTSSLMKGLSIDGSKNEITIGNSSSNAIDELAELYNLLYNIVKSYKQLLDIGISSLENASTIFSETDQKLTEEIG